jgi:hypothetical protein
MTVLASWGGRPPGPTAKITRWRPHRNAAGTILAFFSAKMPSGQIINDLKLMVGRQGRRWVAIPAIKAVDREGNPAWTRPGISWGRKSPSSAIARHRTASRRSSLTRSAASTPRHFRNERGHDRADRDYSFSKSDGPLTKRISLGPDGKVISDGSACVMSRGKARRVKLSSLQELADWIGSLAANQALTLGPLRPDLPDEVEVTTKSKLNGASRPDLIARAQDFIGFCPGKPAFMLLDHDTKGMTGEVRRRIAALGGFWPALTSVMPALKGVSRVVRRSTSAGLYRVDTGEPIAGSDGLHVFIKVQDGTDIEHFLKMLHARCWLAGFGWMIVGSGGQLLERSLIDYLVGGAERLIFEGPPVLDPPLAQDLERRRPVVIEGGRL